MAYSSTLPTTPTSAEQKSLQQQKVGNILAVGNLWYNRESSKSLAKMSETSDAQLKQAEIANSQLQAINANIQKQTGLAQANLAVAQRQLAVAEKAAAVQEENLLKQELRRMEKESAEKESKYRKDAFFHLKEELSDLEKSKISNLEKYFSIKSIKAMFDEYNFSTELTDDLVEKQIIQDSLNKIDTFEEDIYTEFTKTDKKDLDEIIDILETDEELEIGKLQDEKDEIEARLINIRDLKMTHNLGKIVFDFQDIVKKLK